MRSGDLSRFNAIVLPDQNASRIMSGHIVGTMPEEYTGGIGPEGTANLKRFVEQGGTLIAMDHATDYAIDQLGLPVRNVLRNLDSQQFYIPGSLVRIDVENDDPIAFGMRPDATAFFVESQAFSVIPPAGEGERHADRDVDVLARYAQHDLLASGWELGANQYLAGRAAALLADFTRWIS